VEIFKVPLMTFIRSASQAPLDRFQEIGGGEMPVAEQFKTRSSPGVLLIVKGGFVTNFGADQTINKVSADVSPK